MKTKIIIVMLAAVLFLPLQGIAQPKLMVDQPVFEFESVPEGVHVTHEFIIKNTGDTLFHVTNVLPP